LFTELERKILNHIMAAVKQGSVEVTAGLVAAMQGSAPSVQTAPAPMEMSNPPQAVQMDLKALLQDHVLEHPLESAFHG